MNDGKHARDGEEPWATLRDRKELEILQVDMEIDRLRAAVLGSNPIDALDAKIQQMAEDYMQIHYEAEHSVTALDGFLAGWRACEKHYDGGAQ